MQNKDHLGSSTVMTDHPGCLEIEATEYLPFGLTRKQTSTEVTYYKFTDQELDGEVGLYNYNARLYDPAAGIFISPDSILADPFDPQLLNRYSYTRNNPLIYADPTGHYPDPGVGPNGETSHVDRHVEKNPTSDKRKKKGRILNLKY